MGQVMRQGNHEDGHASGHGALWHQVVNWTGAGVSVALVIGVAVWGYELAMRDVKGIPVVRALEGPARVAPEDPGGEQAAYQGLAVNAVAGEGEVGNLPERVALAPEPQELADEDKPTAELRPAARSDTVPETSGDTRASETAEPDDGGADTQDDADPSEMAEAATDEPADPEAGQGIGRSPRPAARPERDLVAEATARATATSMSARSSSSRLEVNPDSLESGTRLVQVGAFEDPETAREEWSRLARLFDAHMDDKRRVIQVAESGGRDFYRLRVHGFADEGEARRFCSVLLAEDQACIPVLIR